MRAFEKTRIEREQKFQARSMHDSMFEPLRGSGPNRTNIPFPLESDGNLIGLQQKAQVSYHLTLFWKITPKLQRIVFIPDLNQRRQPQILMIGSSLIFPARKHLSFCLGSFILSFCSQYWGSLTAAQSTPAHPHFLLLIRLRICMFLRSSHGQLPSTLCDVEYTVMYGVRTWLEIFAHF